MSLIDKIFGKIGSGGVNHIPQGNQNNLQTPPNAATGVYPPTTPVAPPVTPPVNSDPTAKFKDLWTPPKDGEGLEVKVAETLPVEKLVEAAQKADFSKLIPAEKLQAITAGGEGAAQALADIIQATSSAVYQQAVVAASKLAEKQVKDHLEAMTFNNRTEQDRIQAERSLTEKFNNPLVQPFISQTVRQLQMRNPKASPTELQQLAQEALMSAVDVFAPKPIESAKQKPADDWSSYVNG